MVPITVQASTTVFHSRPHQRQEHPHKERFPEVPARTYSQIPLARA